MVNSKILYLISILVFVIGLVLGYLDIDPSVKDLIKDHLPDLPSSLSLGGFASPSDSSGARKKASRKTEVQSLTRVFSAKELEYYNGETSPTELYLALLGRVYDVQKGSKHYGPGGGYHFFAGRDATRSFITGEFDEKQLSDDIKGLSHQDILGIEEWLNFYNSQYKFIGVLEGTYYDGKGRPTRRLKDYRKQLAAARNWQQEQVNEHQRFPPCNSEWNQGKGGRVWCTNKSGGIQRDWVGVPRKLFKPGSSVPRCACVRDKGEPSEGVGEGKSKNSDRGDLDNPNLQLYPGCNPKAVSCTVMKD